MNLTIEFPDLLLADIIERTIKRYLHESSDGYEFLQLHVQRQLKEEIVRQVEAVDLEKVVREFFCTKLIDVVEQAVEKELSRRVKSATQRVLAQNNSFLV
jgi:hypothetical protein